MPKTPCKVKSTNVVILLPKGHTGRSLLLVFDFLDARDDLIRSAVLSGQRPDFSLIPRFCPPFLTNIMIRCWHQKPTQRPSFSSKREVVTYINVQRHILAYFFLVTRLIVYFL